MKTTLRYLLTKIQFEITNIDIIYSLTYKQKGINNLLHKIFKMF